ncbi:hypothetical protein ACW73L_13330 [Methylolobus aquaticus]
MAILPSLICVSAVTRAELMYGLKQLPASHRLQLAVRQFLKLVRVLSWDAEARTITPTSAANGFPPASPSVK